MESGIQLLGAMSIGGILGWYVYLINRTRVAGMHMSDLVTLLATIGGAVALSLFPLSSDLFGAYGVGLGIGFGLCLLFCSKGII
jgi:hypothetical protein